MSYAEKFKVKVPEGRSGSWCVEHFTVTKTEATFEHLRAIVGNSGRPVPEGNYTRLCRGRTVVMSDTPHEIRDHLPFIHMARGRVLIHGLGLGMVVKACLEKEEVTSVTVVDNSPDVIKLVGPTVTKIAEEVGKDLEIIEADCFTWKPKKGARWEAVWHDIWDDLCVDNLEEMGKLHRRFGRRCDFQQSWGKELLQYRRRQQKKNSWE
jgi:hypothetical protein